MAPTSVAADNIAGYTIHSQMPIAQRNPDTAKLGPQGESLKILQLRFKGVTHVIFDEISMIGRRMLGHIDGLLRIATQVSDSRFGGLNIILFGDHGQLPP
eukprot:1639098-Pleurochrysis_carterae.AAC.1